MYSAKFGGVIIMSYLSINSFLLAQKRIKKGTRLLRPPMADTLRFSLSEGRKKLGCASDSFYVYFLQQL